MGFSFWLPFKTHQRGTNSKNDAPIFKIPSVSAAKEKPFSAWLDAMAGTEQKPVYIHVYIYISIFEETLILVNHTGHLQYFVDKVGFGEATIYILYCCFCN